MTFYFQINSSKKVSDLILLLQTCCYECETIACEYFVDYDVDAENPSYDPDAPDAKSHLSFQFVYHLDRGSTQYTVDDKSVALPTGVQLMGSQNGILRLSFQSIDVNNNVTVTVHITADDGRTASFTQMILLVEVPPPKVEIR